MINWETIGSYNRAGNSAGWVVKLKALSARGPYSCIKG